MHFLGDDAIRSGFQKRKKDAPLVEKERKKGGCRIERGGRLYICNKNDIRPFMMMALRADHTRNSLLPSTIIKERNQNWRERG